MENKLNLFNDDRDLNIQRNRGEFLYNSLLKGEYSLDDLGELDRFCVIEHAKYLKEKKLEEQERLIESTCEREEYKDIMKSILALDLPNFDIRKWKLLLNTVSYIDFIEANKETISKVNELEPRRRDLLENLQRAFIRTRDKDNKDLTKVKKEYSDICNKFNKTASKTEQIIRMGYQYSYMLREGKYDDMGKLYKYLDKGRAKELSILAEEFGNIIQKV